MTDQFQFEPNDDAQDPDEPEPEQGPVDRLDDELDEGYAPPVEPWSTGSTFTGTTFTGTTFTGADPDLLEAPAFEERLEHEDPEVEDDWDEDAAGQPEEGGRE